MALEDKQVQELNKNVKNVVKILQSAVGNTATQKAKQGKEEKQSKKKDELLKKEDELLDKKEKEEEQKKIRLFDAVRFVRSSAKDYFDKTDANMITWGGLGKSITSGVKEWFEGAKQQNTMLGRTLRFGAALWQGVNDHIIGAVRNVFGKIGSEMREVLGELGEVFDVIKSGVMAVFNTIKDTLFGFFKQVPPHDRRRNKLLQKMVDFMRRAEKRDMLEFMVPDESIQGLLLPLAMIAAALVGGMVRRFLMPFEAIWKAFRIGTRLKQLKDFVSSLFVMPKWVFKIKWTVIKWWRALGNLFGKAGALVRFAGVLGKLGRAFAWGFKLLGWPLTILIGVFDFIKGFVKAEGSIADRLIAGGWAAIEGFIGLPAKLLGWLVEKILGIFGVEVDGIAEGIMGFIKGFFMLFTAPIRLIGGAIQGLFEGGVTGMIKGFFEAFLKLANYFQPIMEKFEPIRQAIIGFFESAWEWIKGLWDWWPFGDDEEVEGGTPKPKPDISPIDTVSQAEANAKKAQQESQTTAVVDAINEQTEKTMEQNEKLSKDASDNLAVAMATSGDNTKPGGEGDKQLQDEVEIYGLLAGNSNAF